MVTSPTSMLDGSLRKKSAAHDYLLDRLSPYGPLGDTIDGKIISLNCCQSKQHLSGIFIFPPQDLGLFQKIFVLSAQLLDVT
mmetsp:Transcript_23617/g.69866  ORF Transcript_23617/g.69866 Transcript_23617/m.69866 type:complete len:82 (+) Transcript_23617:126-371(+)